jgi:hypothetical protein
LEAEVDARYVTLASLLQSVPEKQREGAKVYRVKPDDKLEDGGKVTYVRRRHVTILNTGFHLCTCVLERHVGIPCRHFFAILRVMRESKHKFNIAQVNLHWHLPHELSRSQNRPWISIHRAPNLASRDQSGNVTDAVLADRGGHSLGSHATRPTTHEEPDGQYLLSDSEDSDDNETINPTPSFYPQNVGAGDRSPPPRAITSLNKRNNYVQLQSRLQRIVTMGPTAEMYDEVIDLLERQIDKMEDVNRVANLQSPIPQIHSPSTPLPSRQRLEDPIMFPKVGRRQEARIKSSLEKRKRDAGSSKANKNKKRCERAKVYDS